METRTSTGHQEPTRRSARAAQLAFDVKTTLFAPAERRVASRFLENEYDDPEQHYLAQRRRSMSLARSAFLTTDFYRRHYGNAGFTERDFDEPHHFDELPVITKADLREHRDEFIARRTTARRRLPSSTGGSTGEPLRVFHDRRSPVAAMWWRVYRWWGVAPWQNRAFVQRERRSDTRQLVEAARWWPTTVLTLDATSMTTERLRAFCEQWRRNQPLLLNGYVGGIQEFAAFVRESGIALPDPVAVGVTAAPISPSQRRFIGDVFGAPVFDSYRSAEVPWMAAECEAHDGLHVLSDVRVVEIVTPTRQPAAPGEVGSIVVTDLTNRVFPILRYDIGDRTSAIAGACACGRTLPRIAGVHGRISDVIRLPTGQSIPGGLTGLFNERPDAVSHFQIHQHNDYAITLRCVAGNAPDAVAAINTAAAKLARLTNGAVPVRVELVARIPHDGGKTRVVRSDLAEVRR